MSKSTKFPNQFNINEIRSRLNNLDPANGIYSFNKQKHPEKLNQVLSLLPSGYQSDLRDKIHSADFIFSGSTEQPFILGLFVGRLDTFKGKETYDIDFFHIAPESGSIDDYFMTQFHHVKDEAGERVSHTLNSSLFTNSIDRGKSIVWRLSHRQYNRIDF